MTGPQNRAVGRTMPRLAQVATRNLVLHRRTVP
jgi:hypothetical protein